jgi:hypothetical protein
MYTHERSLLFPDSRPCNSPADDCCRGCGVGIKRLEQVIEGVDKLVVTQPVVDGAALLANTEQVEVQELTQVCRDRRGS